MSIAGLEYLVGSSVESVWDTLESRVGAGGLDVDVISTGNHRWRSIVRLEPTGLVASRIADIEVLIDRLARMGVVEVLAHQIPGLALPAAPLTVSAVAAAGATAVRFSKDVPKGALVRFVGHMKTYRIESANGRDAELLPNLAAALAVGEVALVEGCTIRSRLAAEATKEVVYGSWGVSDASLIFNETLTG